MDNQADQEMILQGNPGIFRNVWLLLQPWDKVSDPSFYNFDQVPIWIQLWGLPIHCKTKAMGRSIGNILGTVSESELYEYTGKNVIVKIKVDLNVNNPIIPGIHIGNTIDGTSWIDFYYENLPQMCFNFGLEENSPFGPWIRSNIYGRRLIDPKERKHFSNPSISKQFGQNSLPAPDELLKQLADLRIQEARSQPTVQNPLKRPYEHTPSKPSYIPSNLNPLISTPTKALSIDWSDNTNFSSLQMSPKSST